MELSLALASLMSLVAGFCLHRCFFAYRVARIELEREQQFRSSEDIARVSMKLENAEDEVRSLVRRLTYCQEQTITQLKLRCDTLVVNRTLYNSRDQALRRFESLLSAVNSQGLTVKVEDESATIQGS